MDIKTENATDTQKRQTVTATPDAVLEIQADKGRQIVYRFRRGLRFGVGAVLVAD